MASMVALPLLKAEGYRATTFDYDPPTRAAHPADVGMAKPDFSFFLQPSRASVR
jgi:hypothetical protein